MPSPDSIWHSHALHISLALASGALLFWTLDRLREQFSSDSYTFHPPPSLQRLSSLVPSLPEAFQPSSALPSGLPPPGVGIDSCIGNTPLFKLESLSQATKCEIYLKAEALNPGGSPKDRVALSIIKHLESKYDLDSRSGDTIYEATVGSTGISLAILCRARGYGCHILMPSDQSIEKSDLLRHLGAVVERVTPAPITDQAHFVNQARRKAKEHYERGLKGEGNGPEGKGRGFFADQFETDANWKAHYVGTGPEIWRQMESVGGCDAFIAGAGTGGTISGVALYLKERSREAKRKIKVVLADPQGSGLYHKVKHGVMFGDFEREGTRRRDQVDSVIEGIGLTRSTKNFDRGYDEGIIDEAVKVTDQQAGNMARWLVEREGVFAGGSTAVNCTTALKTALALGPGHRIVTIWCDSGVRHLSKFWMQIGQVHSDTEVLVTDILDGKQVPYSQDHIEGTNNSSSSGG